MADLRSHTGTECNCSLSDKAGAATWHDETCPRFANQCENCDGGGVIYTRLSCECCTDIDTCEECAGTGNAPAPVTDDLQTSEKQA